MYKLDWPWTGGGEWFRPETQALTLSERDSTSSITICPGPGVPEIGFNDWLLQEDGPEGPIVWRVKSIDDSVDSQTVTIGLEHVIKYLQDKSFFAEVTTAMMAGTAGATTCTAKQAVEYILAQQGAWVLGDFEYSVSNPYEFDGDSLYDALETVTDSLEDSIWEYDLSVYPFRLHIRQRDNTVQCEMRGERNLSTLRRSVSRSGMYTRLYPIGKNDLHITGEYISENEGLYGRIDKIETDQSKSTEASLLSWASGRLRRHCEPTVSISISGLELESETGETMDRLRLNKVCRVPLPEYGTTITEPIIKKSWKDWISDKIGVTVTLSNSTEDVTTIIKNQSKTSGKAAKGNAKQNYLFEANGEHLYYEVFDECGHLHGLLNMTSESLRIAFDNEISSTRSEFQMTSESLRISFENEISSTRSEFQMTSESLRISFENEISSTRSEFQMTSESLRIAFENEISSTRSEFQMTSESLRISFENEFSSMRTIVEQTDSGWRTALEGVVDENGKVTSASIATAINAQGQAGVKISGAWVKISGTTTINDVFSISDNYVVVSKPMRINDQGLIAKEITLRYGANSSTLTEADFERIIVKAQVSGNTLYLWKNGDDVTSISGASINFSKAVASMGWSWSNGTLTVTPSPQNEDFVIGTLAKGTVTYSNGTYTIPVNLEWGSGANTYTESTGKSFTLSPSVTAGTSAITWDSTNKYFSNYGYAYMGGGSSPVATSAQRTSSALSTSVGNWTDAYTKKKVSVNFGSSEILSETITVSVTAGTSAITWDSSSKKFYNYGYAYLNGNSAANATSAKRESSALSIGDNSWSNGSKKVWVKHGSSEILSDTISIPSVDDTTWENTTGKYWRTRLSIGGVYRYSSTKEFTGYSQEEYDAYWYNGFNDSSWVTKHGLQISHAHHEKLGNVYLSPGDSYDIWPNFMKKGLGYDGSSDDHYLYGDKVTIHASYPSHHCILKYMPEYTTENNGTYTYWFRYQNRTGSPPFTGDKTVYWD